MKKTLLLASLFLPALAHAQLIAYNGECVVGGQRAVTQGLKSSGTAPLGSATVSVGAGVVGSYPKCLVTVYLTGTGTLAPLFSDNVGTVMTNPFTATATNGSFLFFAAGTCYDIQISTGAGPILPSSKTFTGICLGGGGGGGGGSGSVTSVTSGNLPPLFTVNVGTPATTPIFSFALQPFAAHTMFGNCSAGANNPTACLLTIGELPFTYTGNTTLLPTVGSPFTGTGAGTCLDASGNLTTAGCSITPPLVGPYGGTVTSVSSSATLGFATVSGSAVPQFSWNGGAANTLAYLTSNITGNAGTATALASTPTQCTGSFATGIAATGNANCSTADLLTFNELSSRPNPVAGIGNLWFDTTTHALRYNENGGGDVQVGIPVLLNQDTSPGGNAANTLEQSNGAGNPQEMRWYQTLVDSSNWSRARVFYDGANDWVLSSDALGSGTVQRLGFRTGSANRWEITTTTAPNVFRPITDGTYDVGDATHRVEDYYVARTIRTGTATNKDIAGTVVITASTTGTRKFDNTGLTSSPICTVTPTTSPATAGVYWVTTTPTVLTVNITNSTTITFNYICVGRN